MKKAKTKQGSRDCLNIAFRRFCHELSLVLTFSFFLPPASVWLQHKVKLEDVGLLSVSLDPIRLQYWSADDYQTINLLQKRLIRPFPRGSHGSEQKRLRGRWVIGSVFKCWPLEVIISKTANDVFSSRFFHRFQGFFSFPITVADIEESQKREGERMRTKKRKTMKNKRKRKKKERKIKKNFWGKLVGDSKRKKLKRKKRKRKKRKRKR